jgi:drug/metabolite transporter (DMT)-like permease
MGKGILLGLLSYAVFSCADALVKSLGGRLPIFEMGFFITLFALFAVPFVRRPSERWRDMFRMHRPGLVLLRSVAGTVAGIFGVFAFTTLPLAEVYALIFLAPVFVTLLSIPFLGERIGWRRSLAVFAGFAGVLLVVRPGFRELSLGHLAAIGIALSGAITVIVLRALGPTERRITLMGTVMIMALVANFFLMLFDFRTPSPLDLVKCAAAGLLAGFGHVLIMAALRAAPANRIAPGQYSQIVWAMILGAMFFDEFPDSTALAGIALVTFAGLFTFIREEQTGGRWPPVWTIVWTKAPRNGRRT